MRLRQRQPSKASCRVLSLFQTRLPAVTPHLAVFLLHRRHRRRSVLRRVWVVRLRQRHLTNRDRSKGRMRTAYGGAVSSRTIKELVRLYLPKMQRLLALPTEQAVAVLRSRRVEALTPEEIAYIRRLGEEADTRSRPPPILHRLVQRRSTIGPSPGSGS